MVSIKVIEGDITRLKIDAIVNAANTTLMGGGGVDGAIHHAAGPGLLKECMALNGCKTGEAKITSGYNLPVKFIIHTVGPIWNGGSRGEKELLASCYRNSLRIAENTKLKSIAFPNISTGVYRFPRTLAAEIAIQEVRKFVKTCHEIEKIIFVAFDEENYALYKKLLKES
jgi:O-acetyl-ADP-ribose deacetylase (regulator of RNase III)